MITAPKSRREFLKGTVSTLAGAALMPASSYARVAGANDRVRVGVVGFSDRFRSSLLPAFLQNAKNFHFEFVAVWQQLEWRGIRPFEIRKRCGNSPTPP
jgi:hypothetical protein